MSQYNAQYWIDTLALEPHPEGGYYREVYRSSGSFTPNEIGAERTYATSIYFLIERDNVSHFHSIKQDELWFYHAGAALSVYAISSSGALDEMVIGRETNKGQVLQAVIPAGAIFGSKSTGDYSLVSCVVAPGFDFRDFILYPKKDLMERFPELLDIIQELGYDK